MANKDWSIDKDAPEMHKAIIAGAEKEVAATREFYQKLMPICQELSTLPIYPNEIRILAEAMKNILGNMLASSEQFLFWTQQFELHSMQLLILEDKFSKGEDIH